MTGMVFGSVGTPLAPWHVVQSWVFASISSAAWPGGMANARAVRAIAEKKRLDMTSFLPTRMMPWISSGEPYARQTDVDPCRRRYRDGVSAREPHRQGSRRFSADRRCQLRSRRQDGG